MTEVSDLSKRFGPVTGVWELTGPDTVARRRAGTRGGAACATVRTRNGQRPGTRTPSAW
jgi:hypothetical protein